MCTRSVIFPEGQAGVRAAGSHVLEDGEPVEEGRPWNTKPERASAEHGLLLMRSMRVPKR